MVFSFDRVPSEIYGNPHEKRILLHWRGRPISKHFQELPWLSPVDRESESVVLIQPRMFWVRISYLICHLRYQLLCSSAIGRNEQRRSFSRCLLYCWYHQGSIELRLHELRRSWLTMSPRVYPWECFLGPVIACIFPSLWLFQIEDIYGFILWVVWRVYRSVDFHTADLQSTNNAQ